MSQLFCAEVSQHNTDLIRSYDSENVDIFFQMGWAHQPGLILQKDVDIR